ncbi:MAG TPA: serine/threonine-protein kinase [Thermoanaerobaculia bacterium]|nr:serine/threonine-protein kinase [Thermoanaerobaculia bacterium]
MFVLPLQRIEGKYEILGKIREGGMGAIYKVRHLLLDEIRVIKLMRPLLVEDRELQAELKARFIREARVAIKLRHPNIAQLYDFTTDDDGTSLIVMEFIRGKTLEELLKTAGPPSLGLAIEIALQSLRALGYLHAKGFVHRDISPDNLMLTEDAGEPRIKLIDLGIAKILGAADSQLTRTGTFLGKVRYASPEQFAAAGAATAGARGDLYSFGVVLYELLTGSYPITGSDASSIIAGHLFHEPIEFEETDRQGRVPLSLRSAVLKALAKQPEGRYASAEELARELERYRVPAGVPAEEWKKLLAVAGEEEVSSVEPGTTQHLLDERFRAGPTPAPTLPSKAPGHLLGAARAVNGHAAVPSPQAEVVENPRRQGPELEKERRELAGSRHLRPAAVAAGMALLVAAFAASAWLLWRHGEHAAGPGMEVKRRVVDSAEAGPGAAPQRSGALIVDALPWAEVVEVRDGAGKTRPMPPAAYTPIVLSLPPGRYTIRLWNPAFPRPAVIAAEVPAGGGAQPVRAVAEFRAGDPDEFLKEMGW